MVGRHARDASERLQGDPLLPRVGLDVGADAPHQLRMRMGRDVARMAALAGAEPRVLRGGRVGKEDDLTGARLSRGAGRPAVDPGGADSKDEPPVLARVARHDGPPAGVRRGAAITLRCGSGLEGLGA